MALRATWTVQSTPIRNTGASAVLSLFNSGLQPITIFLVSPWASGGAGSPTYAQQECRTCPFTIPAGATLTVPLNFVLPMSQIDLGLSFILGVTVSSNDPVVGLLYLLTDLLMTETTTPVVSPLAQTITPVAAGR